MININDFFDISFDNVPVQKPINRNAFTLEDIKYKVKCIKAMQDLGMIVTIDKIGNICGMIPGKIFTDKSVICGSHTDSVDDAGQFDGPLGVYAALKTGEDIINSGKTHLVNYKAIIYASEESTRFEGKACLGSKYLRGDNLDFDAIISRDGLSLKEIVANYKTELFKELSESGLNPITEVDKVIENSEIITALEGHIEQADVLREAKSNIGICTSIVAPYRLKADITNIETAAQFICDLTETAQKTENLSKYRITVPEFSIKNNYDKSELQNKNIVTFRVNGKSNHSGATPMNKRNDPIYGTAKFINLLSNNSAVQFLETCTPEWGANQINDCCEIKLAINPNASEKEILNFWFAQKDASKIANVHFQRINDFTKKDKETGLFIDVRQQIGMNTKLSSEMIFDCIKDIVHMTHCNAYMNVTAKGEPYQTNSDLVDSATQICEEKNIPYEIMESWAGHDLATLTKNKNARTLLLFCDNSGGSHNPNETTTVDAINKLVDVESALAQKELERVNELYFKQTSISSNEQVKNNTSLSKETRISLEKQTNLDER